MVILYALDVINGFNPIRISCICSDKYVTKSF